jgi:hypothetical protein
MVGTGSDSVGGAVATDGDGRPVRTTLPERAWCACALAL